MILEKICAVENLQEAWKRVRFNKPGPGIDRVRWEVLTSLKGKCHIAGGFNHRYE